MAKREGGRRLRRVGVIAILLGGLYAVLRFHQPEPSRPRLDRTVTFALSIGAPQPGAPLPTFTVHRGDKVVILIRSDVAGAFHLHGYDREIPLKPGAKAKLGFEAGLSGQFPIELHEADGSERQIARLAVQPR